MGADQRPELNGLVIRVDDRLIHGQILYGWARGWPAEEVWLAHDRIAADSAERALYEEQLGQSVLGGVISVDTAIARFAVRTVEPAGDSSPDSIINAGMATRAGRHILLIVSGCHDLERLIDGGIRPVEVHIANLGEGEGREAVAETVRLSAADCEAIRRLANCGIMVCLRNLPHSRTKPVPLPRTPGREDSHAPDRGSLPVPPA